MTKPPKMTLAEFYEKIRANQLVLSFSSLSRLYESPRTFKEYFTEPFEQTDSMVLGSLIHCLILQPEKYDSEYLLKPANANKSSNANKKRLEAFEAILGDRTPISETQLKTAKEVAAKVLSNPKTNPYLIGEKEVREYFEIEGVPMVKVCDIINDFGIVDIKSGENRNARKFSRKAIYDYMYHLQAAIYTHNSERLFYILAVDSKGYSCPHIFSEERLQDGRELLSKLLAAYRSLSFDFIVGGNESVWDSEVTYWMPEGYNTIY